MKQDNETKIAHLESENSRLKSDFAIVSAILLETEGHLRRARDERDQFRDEVAHLRLSRASVRNERDALRSKLSDLTPSTHQVVHTFACLSLIIF